MDFSALNLKKGFEIEAPARLHLGFLDMDGSLGRRFGSIGVGIEGLSTRITLRPQETLTIEGPDRERALSAIERLEHHLSRPLIGRVEILECVPPHAGLGSGTQMALATGVAVACLNGIDLKPREVAAILGRGGRSGIGVAAFETGGLILDGGRSPKTRVPPVLSRIPMPDQWRFIIVLDPEYKGLNGPAELEAFRSLPVFPGETAARLCHALLMKGLPAVLEEDLESFGQVIEDLQKTVGDHFAPAQGGRFTSSKVSEALAFLSGEGAYGIGQSSWGPTGFCLVESEARARLLLDRLGQRAGLDIRICSPRAGGAKLMPLEDAP